MAYASGIVTHIAYLLNTLSHEVKIHGWHPDHETVLELSPNYPAYHLVLTLTDQSAWLCQSLTFTFSISTATLTTITMADAKEFTFQEVSAHNTKKDLYMVIHDKVYDCTSFVDEHPYVHHHSLPTCTSLPN